MKTVINLHMPKDEATYIHRVGRTARAGHAGRAVTFVEEERRMMMKDLVRRAVAANQQIKTRVISKSVERSVWMKWSRSRSSKRSWRS